MIVYKSEEDRIAFQYFKDLNNNIGMFAFTLTLTSLGFTYSNKVALLSLLVLLVMAFSKGDAYKKIVNTFLPENARWVVYLSIFWQLKIFLFGMSLLCCVALGFVDNEFLAWVFNVKP